MAQFSRIEVMQTMEQTGLVPLFYHDNLEESKRVVHACYKGGARVLEFTSRGDFAFQIFEGLIKYCIKELPGMILGVGSITDAGMASHYMQLGANFIVTPVFRKDIAIVCNRRKVLWAPGCGTLTEIALAEEMGCELVKLFPGGTYGADFVKAIKGPCPWTNIMPTGGVSPTEESLQKWFQAGVSCVGMGSKLITKSDDGTFDLDQIQSNVHKSIDIISTLRNA